MQQKTHWYGGKELKRALYGHIAAVFVKAKLPGTHIGGLWQEAGYCSEPQREPAALLEKLDIVVHSRAGQILNEGKVDVN